MRRKMNNINLMHYVEKYTKDRHNKTKILHKHQLWNMFQILTLNKSGQPLVKFKNQKQSDDSRLIELPGFSEPVKFLVSPLIVQKWGAAVTGSFFRSNHPSATQQVLGHQWKVSAFLQCQRKIHQFIRRQVRINIRKQI